MAEAPERLNKTEARAGTNVKPIVWVLVISVILAALAMWWAFARTPEERVEGSADSYKAPNTGVPGQP